MQFVGRAALAPIDFVLFGDLLGVWLGQCLLEAIFRELGCAMLTLFMILRKVRVCGRSCRSHYRRNLSCIVSAA